MIKRRTQAPTLTEDDFVNGVTANSANETPNLDPKAPRKFFGHFLIIKTIIFDTYLVVNKAQYSSNLVIF